MFFKDFLAGIAAYRSAWRVMRQHRLSTYLIWPLIIGLLLSMGWLRLGTEIHTLVMGLMPQSWWALQPELAILQWLLQVAQWLISAAVYLVVLLIGVKFQAYIVLALMSPILSHLSEKTETILAGKEFDFKWTYLLQDVKRALLLLLRNFFIEMSITAALVVLTYIPVIGWISSLALLVLSAYFYGFSFMDYSLERHGLKVRESIRYVRRKRGLTCGIGAPFTAVFFVPVIGPLLATFLAIPATIAATLTNINGLSVESRRATPSTPLPK